MYSGGVHQLGLKLMKSKNHNNTLSCLSVLFTSVFFTPISIANQDKSDNQSLPTELETITVISSKIPLSFRQLATSVSVITKEDIDARGNASLADIMRHEVGIGVSNSGGIGKNTTLRIRGEDGFRTKVYIDGVELSDPTAPQVSPIFDDILTHFIDRVEILRGPQGLMYGADAGGVVSITTKQNEPGLQATIHAQSGSFSTQMLNADLGYANKNAHVYLGAAEFETAGFNAQTTDVSNEKDGYQNTTLHFNSGVNLNEALLVNLVVRRVSANNEYDGCYDNVNFELIHQCTTDSENQTARLSLQYNQDMSHHNLAYAKTDVERQFFSNEQFSFGSEGNISKVEYNGYYGSEQQKLIWGLDNESQRLKGSGEQREQTGLYFEYQKAWIEQLFITAGMRHDNNDTFGTHNSYRISAAYLIPLSEQETFKLKSTYGTGFRAPSLYEQDYNDGDFAYGDAAGLQLNEESSKGFDFGFDYINKTQNLSLVFFKQSISNEIYFDSIAYTGYLQNTLSSESKGLEFELSQQFNEDIKLWSNYTFNKAQTNTQEDRVRRPKHQLNLGLQSQFLDDRLKLNLSIKMVKDLLDIGGVTLDDYNVVNLTSLYQFNRTLGINLRVENLLNREYQDVAGFNTAHRSFYVGMTITL
jgi:vitamin B12 transporter